MSASKIVSLVTVVLAVLKLTNVVDWSWTVVLLPLTAFWAFSFLLLGSLSKGSKQDRASLPQPSEEDYARMRKRVMNYSAKTKK